jgi:hypothetical protein
MLPSSLGVMVTGSAVERFSHVSGERSSSLALTRNLPAVP